MSRRIKGLPDRWNRLDAEFAQGARQLLEREVDSLDQPVASAAAFGRLNRPFQIIDDGQEFLEQLLVPEFDLIPLVALGDPLVVIELSGQPEVAIVQQLEFFVFGIERLI